MSWAEEQDWFGMEDVALDYINEQQEIKEEILYMHTWRTKTGKCIPIREMKKSHLINCINKCKRDRWRLYALPILEQELKRR